MLNRLYGSLAIGEDAAEHGAIRAANNSSFGLKDVGLGTAGTVAGLASGHPLAMGAALAGGSKLARQFGPGIQGALANQAAKFVPGTGKVFVAAGAPLGAAAQNAWPPSDAPHNPMKALNQVAASVPALQQAQQAGGPQQMAATNYAMAQQSPQYRDLLKRVQGGNKQ